MRVFHPVSGFNMLSILASSVGGTLLKGLIGIWLKDQQILKLGSQAAIDALQKKTSNYLETRKVKRLLEQLEDEILESLAIYLEAEFKAVRSGDKILLVEGAIELVSSQEFYLACYEQNFDQKRLLELFRVNIEEFTKSKMIGDIEAAVSICSFVIAKFLAVLGSFPKFSEDALRAILGDTDELLERVRSIEIELTTLEVKAKAELEEDERNFRRMVATTMQKVDVFGIDSRGLPKRYDLSLAYVNLTLTSDGDGKEDESIKTLAAAFSRENRVVVVRGNPGSGKTTLLSWLALNCAEFTLPIQLESIASKIPIFIRVREYAEKELPVGIRLLTEQFGPACDAFTERWMEETIRTGNFIVFVDGFDEVSEARRLKVIVWSKAILEYYPDATLVVTTRPYANNELDDLSRQFASQDAGISVEPMNPKQVEAFIKNWYRAYSMEAAKLTQTEKFDVSRERLLDRLLHSASLRSLIRNPLICSLICFVNVDRDGFVPDQRGDLYLLATQTLLDRRDRERGIVYSHELNLTLALKFKIIGYVAEYFFKRRSAQLERDSIVVVLEEYLPSLGIRAELSGNVVDYLAERSHVLRCPSTGYVDFSHKTFLEYFYARRLTDLDMIEVVAEEFFTADFREVVLFSFAVGTPPFVDKLLELVIFKIKELKEAQKETSAATLVLQTAIQQAPEVGVAMREAAVALLSDVLPPKSSDEADQLARAGDVILDPLKSYACRKYSTYWRHIISALLGTYSEEAAYTLMLYAKMNDPRVDQQLLAGRKYFETETYRKVVISECKTIDSCKVHDWDDLEIIAALPNISEILVHQYGDKWTDAKLTVNKNVRSLEIHSANAINDLSILEYFPNLQKMSIMGCEGLDDFSALERCKDLKSLTIYSHIIKDLDFLKKLRGLTTIDLAECTELFDVSALNKLSRIKTLFLPYSHQYDDLTISLDEMEIELDPDFVVASELTDLEIENLMEGGEVEHDVGM